jgi:chromosome segregation ATPase
LEKEIVDPEAVIRQIRTRLEAADSKVTATEQERDGYALRLERLRAQSDTQAQELARTIALSQQQQGELVRLRRECDRIETHAAVLKDKLDAAWEAQTAIKQRYKEATSDHWYQFGRLNWKGKLRSLLASGSRKLKK